MAVIKSKRGESSVQYLDTARKLVIFTMTHAVKFPKRYRSTSTDRVINLSGDVYDHVKAANSIYPSTHEDVILRRTHLVEANNALQCLISQLDIAKEMFASTVESKVWEDWMNLIAEEARLITGVKRSDKERYKNI